ncbi:hypothetical protein [Mycobacterium sp. AT1]|uniref:hypothetical protein n=1 Tax=Mycobacterium sp. AT1 TaxID=1961706 RepID=UPI001153DCB9|nr:hypothetical protein [Mycobacterium sp. AT1]
MKRVRPLTTVVVVVAVLIGSAIWWMFFRGPSSSDCAPVREMLAFNKSEIDALNAKTHVPEPGSSEAATDPSELDYRAWVDGLTDRAAKVTAPELAGPAKETAETADRLVRARLDFDAQSARTAPGAVAPASAMIVAAFNDQFEAQVTQLTKTCTS